MPKWRLSGGKRIESCRITAPASKSPLVSPAAIAICKADIRAFSVDLLKERARRQYGDRCGRSRSPSRSDGGDPAAIPNTQNGEATQGKSLKNALMNNPALRGFYKIEQRAHPGRCRA